MTTFFGALVSLCCLLAAQTAQAQSYPSKQITLVVTAAAGGVTDVVARALGQRLAEMWGQQVVIENRGGAAHILGAQAVAKAAPDGHTLLVAEAGTFVLNPTIYPKEKLSYDTEKDLLPITGLVRINQALIADNGLAASNVRELIELANRKPGEITYGTAGVGTAKPTQQLPGAPTVSESGVPGYEAGTWFGLATTGGTPRAIVMKINAEVQKILTDAAFVQRFMAPQMFESMGSSPEQFSDYIKSETQSWTKVIREQGLKLE